MVGFLRFSGGGGFCLLVSFGGILFVSFWFVCIFLCAVVGFLCVSLFNFHSFSGHYSRCI